MIVEGGLPRFQYDGYWFVLDDPIPEYWGSDWYDSDEMYVDYDPADGGYYLYDTRYPDDRVAVSVLAG